MKKSAQEVLEDTWERRTDVLKTVAGGAAFVGAALLTKVALHDLSNDFAMGHIMTGLRAGILLGPVSALTVGGVLGSKEPVKRAVQFMKNKFQKK